MSRKHTFFAVAAVLAAVGLWFALSTWRTATVPESSAATGAETPPGPPQPGPEHALHESPGGVGEEAPPGAVHSGRIPRPPEPNRRFLDFTPEQRVEFARRGHGPGG